MTTMTFNNAAANSYFVAARAPKKSFAARLAELQAKHEDAAAKARDVAGVSIRLGLALVPFTALAWTFISL